MNDLVRLALDSDQLVDITTMGRKTGQQHRLEVALRHVDGQIYLSNSPGKRDWAANLLAKPEFTYHLKQSTQIDLAVRAAPIKGGREKRELLTKILTKEGHLDQLEARMEGSHLFRVDVLEPTRIRPDWEVAVLTVISLGGYFAVWMAVTWSELKRESGDDEMHPVWHGLALFVPVYHAFADFRHFQLKQVLDQPDMGSG